MRGGGGEAAIPEGVRRGHGGRRAALVGRCGLTFFFLQAEDGIRDLIVTGVQTCALPIPPRPGVSSAGKRLIRDSEYFCFPAPSLGRTRRSASAPPATKLLIRVKLDAHRKFLVDRKSVV